MHRKIPLPRGWKRRAKSAILHILALGHYTFSALLPDQVCRERSVVSAC